MDPVTAALLIQGTMAGGQALYGLNQQTRAKRSMAMMDDPLDVTPASRLRLLNASKDQSIANQAVDQINRSLGTSVNALQSGGSRAAGALSGVQRAADAAKTDVLYRQREQEMNAMARVNQGEERDRIQQVQQFRTDRADLQKARAAGVQNIGNAAISLGSGLAQANLQKGSGAAISRADKKTARDARMLSDQLKADKSLLNEGLNAGADRGGFGPGLGLNMDPQISTPDVTGKFDKSGLDELLDVNIPEENNLPRALDVKENISLGKENFPEYTGIRDLPKNTSRSNTIVLNPDGGYDFDETKLSDQGYGEKMKEVPTGKRISRTPESASDRSKSIGNARYMQNLGLKGLDKYGRPLEVIEFEDQFEEETFKKGGKKYKAKKTPGKFSHKSNPLHIVAKSGDKVGEMTGGEYIFNPTQASSLRKHSKSGSSPLHKFVRQMLSKSQFK